MRGGQKILQDLVFCGLMMIVKNSLKKIKYIHKYYNYEFFHACVFIFKL